MHDTLSNPRLLEQAKFRRSLHFLFEHIFEKIEDVNLDINDALETGLIDHETVRELYDRISDFIEHDENNTRLLLYLPFEILPDTSALDSMKENLSDSATRFVNLYRASWIRLLHEIEPRANFVDGDVLEPGLPEPEQISKAGHLIPELLAKGIISVDEVLQLMDIIKDPRAVKPMAEGATVARDTGLIGDADWQKIHEIISRKLPNTALGPIKYDESSFHNVSPERKRWLARLKEEAASGTQYDRVAGFDLSAAQPVATEAIAADFSAIVEIVKKIHADPLLASTLYPTMLVFGSRIKGYAGANADYDAAVLFRPTVVPEQRAQVLTHLYAVIPEITKIDRLLEYWPAQGEKGLEFRQEEENPFAIGSKQVHFFLGGAWISQDREYQRLRRDVLEQYLDLSRFGDQKKAVRSSLLARMEVDVLQYRLMHEGFKRFYPSRKKQGTQNSDLIDWESDFWDPGYRRVATKLFISRVFLPDLS